MRSLSAANKKVNVSYRWKEQQARDSGGNWRNSALLTKDREKIQTSEKTERESESEDWSTV